MRHSKRKKDPGREQHSNLLTNQDDNFYDDIDDDDDLVLSVNGGGTLDEEGAEEEEIDFEDNLSYHEDTLSVMKGAISTPLGKDIPVWITTDSGSMTQLIQGDYARSLKLPRKALRGRSCFNISSPGGGKEFVNEYVEFQLKVKAKREDTPGQQYTENVALEEWQTISMKFGVCDSLPVPILWGGKQMRRYDLLDYHRNKVLSFQLSDARYMTTSTSWLVASSEMTQIAAPKIKKIYKAFYPTKERLTNMIRGERRTINMPTVLYPGRDTVVRVGRHNARVDEGYNEVVALNGEEVMEQYKGWVVVMDSVSNGEAFIIVRNNSEQAISLPAGTLNIAIRPTICLPRILSRADVQKVEAAQSEPEDPAANPNSPAGNRVMTTLSEHHSVTGAVPETKDPTTFFSWNCNGLGSRVKGSDLEARFYSQLTKLDPDVVSLQEIRLQCKPEHPSEILPGSKDESQWEVFMEPLRERYDVYLTLSSRRYGGQAVLVKKGLTPPRVTFNMGTNTGHYGSGRFMKLEFTNIVVRSVYAPFNGVGKEEQLQRRRDWDERLYHELTHELDPTKGRVVLGDFNAVYRESDMSNDTDFWKRQGAQDIEEADRGFGGTTTNERRRFRDILECGELADSFTVPTGNKLEARWTFRGQGKFHGKGLKLDYIFADDTILLSGGVKSSRILCNGRDRDGFMGSDHAPLFCELHPRWNRKQSNLRAHYGAALRSTESQLTQLVRTQEETIQVANMFANTIARQSLPKSREGRVEPGEFKGDGRPAGISDMLWSELGQSVKEKVILNVAGYEAEYVTDCIHKKLETVEGRMAEVHEGAEPCEGDRKILQVKALMDLDLERESRPAEFPEALWAKVSPEQKSKVKARYDSFKSKEYLEECIRKVVEELDIQKRDEYYSPLWKSETEEEWEQRDVLMAQALANLDIYFFPDPEKVKMAKDVVAEVETIDEKPHKCKTRKLSVVQQAFLQAKTNIMLRMKQLEEAKSDWCHGLVLVAYEDRINAFMEKHGDDAMEKLFQEEYEAEVATFFRLCMDLRMLNAKTIPDRFPLPRIDDLLESIPRGCGRFSISDIADAFFKCELKKEHRHKTAFKTHNRHLQFSVLPQGFINSPSVFCRLIARTFEGVDRRKFSAYIDDVLNHTEDFQDHMEVQQDTYDRLRASQLTLKLSKTHLNYSEVKFLGHILTKAGRLPDPKAVEAILDWKDPTTAKEVRSFLGATLYYREYIYQYSDMAMPLYDLIRKGVVVDKAWDPELHGPAIQKIKDALTSKPVLMQVDNTKKFRLKVDACRKGRGIGGILEQQNDEGKWQPVSYYSSSLSKEERQYSATELECKALHDCILHYAVYLKYIPHFEVFSDHNALRYMVNSENATTNGRLMRYLLDLQGFNFAIYYRKGTENCDADAVSRLTRTTDQPIYLTEDELNEENGVVSRHLLQRARALDTRNKKTEKEARKLLSKMAKDTLQEMSTLNDHILAEGVENLESETGRSRFFENIQKRGLKCSRVILDETLEKMQEDQGGRNGEANLAAEIWSSDEPAVVMLLDIWSEAGAVEASGMTEHCLNTMTHTSKSDEQVYLSKEKDFDKASSDAELPGLLINMVEAVKDDQENNGRAVQARHDLDANELVQKRAQTQERCLSLYAETKLAMAVSKRVTRSAARAGNKSEVSPDQKDPDQGTEKGKELTHAQRQGNPKKVKKLKRMLKKAIVEEFQQQMKMSGAGKDQQMATVDEKVEDSSQEDSEDAMERLEEDQLPGGEDDEEEFTEEERLVMERVDQPKPPTRSRMYTLRKVRAVDYTEEAKTQPNWIRTEEEAAPGELKFERHSVNTQLEAVRRPGYGTVEVRRSLIPGDSGQGLYACKRIKNGKTICSYEGVEVSEDTLRQGYGNRDYVASGIKDHRTREMVYVDGEALLSCYGRFAQDPIDDNLVNAKILWRDGKLVLVAMGDIQLGDEIYVEYGLDYWRDRLHFLHPELRKRLESKCDRPTVRFEPECTMCDYLIDSEPKGKNGLRIKAQGIPLQKTPDNLLTRVERFVPEPEVEEEEEPAEVDPDTVIFEECSLENVDECPALADELQFLVGRKYVDEGRKYMIDIIQWDPHYEHVIGFRRPLSGRTHKEDTCPFLVYGREGLFELSERYLLSHPEERENIPWPSTVEDWATMQQEDEHLVEIMNEIRESGGDTIKKDRHKFALRPTKEKDLPLLLRIVSDNRKGTIEQTMVPRKLVKPTLKIHHEGFAHMGANRMLETIRLRYFWSKMDKDIVKHTGKCINCKLRKSYQRRPTVPIMKYDDTARPLDRVHVDLTGPLPQTKGNHKYIMVIKDYLTKYVWLIPLKSKGSVEVAEAFVGEFVCQAGIPGRLVSDRGNEFVNKLLANVSRIMGINRVSTTPYNPRSDGFVENHNKTLKDQLYHYVDTLKQDDWDVYLPTVQLMYNTTVSLATGFTPMLLMTGREARMPSFSHMATEVDKIKRSDQPSNELVLKMVDTMRGYHEFALKQTARNKERFNVKVRKPLEFVEYEPGQEFLRVRRPISTFKSADEEEAWKISMKLLERYEGPYKIIRKINPVVYDADINGKEVRVHAGNMKPF